MDLPKFYYSFFWLRAFCCWAICTGSAVYSNELRVSGSNDHGQLATGDSEYYTAFVKVADNVVEMDLGLKFGVYRTADGQLWGVGNDGSGQLGIKGDEEEDYGVYPASRLEEDVDFYHANYNWMFYSLAGDPRLFGRGYDSIGFWEGEPLRREAAPIFDLANVVKMDSGWVSALFLLDDGRLYGLSSFSWALGLGFDAIAPTEPVLLAENVVDMGLSWYRPQYVDADGNLVRMGYGPTRETLATGVLAVAGDGSDSTYYIDSMGVLRDTRGAVYAENVREVVADGSTLAYINNDNQLWAKGENGSGRLAAGDLADVPSPRLVRENVAKVALGGGAMYVLDLDGTLFGAGINAFSVLGQGRGQTAAVPRLLSTNTVAVDVSDGVLYYTTEDGALYGAGSNALGQMGTGDYRVVASPTLIASGIRSFDSSAGHLAFVNDASELWAVGQVREHESGTGPKESVLPILLDTEVVGVFAGPFSTAYIKSNGSLWLRRSHPPAIQVAEGVLTAANSGSLFYVAADGSLYTDHHKFIDEYDESQASDESSSQVMIDQDVAQAAAGRDFVAYVKGDGSLWAAGALSFLGETEEEFTLEPRWLATDVTRVEATDWLVMYQKSNGSLWKLSELERHTPPDSNHLPGIPMQIWQDAEIHAFSVSEANVAYITAPVETPVVLSSTIDRANVGPGEKVLLEADASGSFATYQWYQGEVGDRNTPVGATRSLSVFPSEDARYWLEATNNAGTASSTALEVDVDFDEYASWAKTMGLIGASALYHRDDDGDGNPNLVEFAFGLSPGSPDASPLALSMDAAGSRCIVSIARPVKDSASVQVLQRSVAVEEWTVVAEDRLQETENGTLQFDIPLPESGGQLVRIGAAPAPPE